MLTNIANVLTEHFTLLLSQDNEIKDFMDIYTKQ